MMAIYHIIIILCCTSYVFSQTSQNNPKKAVKNMAASSSIRYPSVMSNYPQINYRRNYGFRPNQPLLQPLVQVRTFETHKGGYGKGYKDDKGYDDHHEGYGHDNHKGYKGHTGFNAHDKGYNKAFDKGYDKGYKVHDTGYKGRDKGHDDHHGGYEQQNSYGHDQHNDHGGYGHEPVHQGGYDDHKHPPKLQHKPAPYKGPKYSPYDFIPNGKATKSKKGKFGDDPVSESKKRGYHQTHEYPMSHFGGFGGGGSSKGHKGGGGYGHEPSHGGHGHGKGGYGKGHGKSFDEYFDHGYEKQSRFEPLTAHHGDSGPNTHLDSSGLDYTIPYEGIDVGHENYDASGFQTQNLGHNDYNFPHEFDSLKTDTAKDHEPGANAIYEINGPKLEPGAIHKDQLVLNKGKDEYVAITPDQDHFVLPDVKNHKSNDNKYNKDEIYTDPVEPAKPRNIHEPRQEPRVEVIPMLKNDPYNSKSESKMIASIHKFGDKAMSAIERGKKELDDGLKFWNESKP